MQNFNTKVATNTESVLRNKGTVRVVEGVSVEFVSHSDSHHIRIQKYTANHAKLNDRPYVVVATGRGYATLANAVRAMYKNGFAPL